MRAPALPDPDRPTPRTQDTAPPDTDRPDTDSPAADRPDADCPGLDPADPGSSAADPAHPDHPHLDHPHLDHLHPGHRDPDHPDPGHPDPGHPDPGRRDALRRPGFRGSRVRERGGRGRDPDAWRPLLSLLHEFTPVVEVLPPDAALADVSGSVRYFGRDPLGIARLIRVRALAWQGLDCAVGVAPNPMLARMAARDAGPGAVRRVGAAPGEIAGFLDPKPVAALHGVGPRTAHALGAYGLDTVGKVAGAPEGVLQRILGARAGRLVHERARGIDRAAVVPRAPAPSVGARHRFVRYELDAAMRRRVLLGLATGIGRRLRDDGRAARALTLTVHYADRTTSTRTRALREPTAHTHALADAAYALHDALGLQRARVAALGLRAEELVAAERASCQLTFGRGQEGALRIEPVVDRIAARWPGVVGPAAVMGPAGERPAPEEEGGA
ncbi:hypothetical protein [Streptomyces sp. NPDC050560]|uniref:DNA polymerase Y family protein n=1 Tax=Streptomyces sp. NPDC050560 TaxID=3365630 RepID=UPI00378BF9FF